MPMKVAMITPYHRESVEVLKKCHASVAAQSHHNVTHIMVADGEPHPWCRTVPVEHMILPCSHRDAGATPRALAAISAFSRGYDAVGFIDADNWIDPDHVASMLETLNHTGGDGVIATRRIHAMDGSELYVDNIESNGVNMVDTNCMFLGRKSLHLMTYWVTVPEMRLWSDRAFWDVVKKANLTITRCTKPTVAYVSRWAWHYQHAGVPIPPSAVWIDQDEQGNLIHTRHEDKR
jgi:glycosyltransferase involved in cell wall biosynthesis